MLTDELLPSPHTNQYAFSWNVPPLPTVGTLWMTLFAIAMGCAEMQFTFKKDKETEHKSLDPIVSS